MKVSLNMAQYFSNVDLKKLPKPKLLEKIGEQLGSVEDFIDWGPRFNGIVLAKVVECIKHPNADKLHVCKIDDGGLNKKVSRDKQGLIQVVCGAPNVKAGMLVVWIPPGSTVPSTFDKEPFLLESRELRGVVSNGMLASGSELGFSDDADGLLEINPEDEEHKDLAKPGTLLSRLYELDDLIIDLENKMFTHRPDCFGVLGVARELAGIQNMSFKSPDWYLDDSPTFKSNLADKEKLTLEVRVDDKKLVPRFMAVAIKGVRVKPSPVDMQAGLSRVGLKPINNIVDITNFFMHLTGQPMHAYDYDKILSLSSKKPALIARLSKKGEKVRVLGGKEVILDDSTIVIATDKKVIGIGGVMGGEETEVDKSTKNIILECANFDMYSIRRASMKHGLFTDAVTRFNKGQSPLQNDKILAYVSEFIHQTTRGEVASEVYDEKIKLSEPGSIKVDSEFINSILGSNLSAVQIQKLLQNVEFRVVLQGQILKVTPPFWRMDIHIPEDVVEEVGRLYGFGKLPVSLPTRRISHPQQNATLGLKRSIRNILSSAGANEALTYSFVHENLLKNVGQDTKKAYQINNAISPDLQFYRLSLIPSLLDRVHANIKADYIRSDDNEFSLFELNKTHNKQAIGKDKLPLENERLAVVFAADDKTAKRKYKGAPYYMAVAYLKTLLESLDLAITQTQVVNAKDYFVANEIPEYAKPFELNRSAVLFLDDKKIPIGIIGEFKSSIKASLKLPNFCSGIELDLDKLVDYIGGGGYTPIPKFPKITQDVSFKIKSDIDVQSFYETFQAKLGEVLQQGTNYIVNYEIIDLYVGKDQKQKTITLRMWFWDYDKTLTTTEINKFLDSLSKLLSKSIKAQRI